MTESNGNYFDDNNDDQNDDHDGDDNIFESKKDLHKNNNNSRNAAAAGKIFIDASKDDAVNKRVENVLDTFNNIPNSFNNDNDNDANGD